MLFLVPFDGAPMLRARALRAQNATDTYSDGSPVFGHARQRIDPVWFKYLTGRTAIDVLHWIVNKGFLAKDALRAPGASGASGISHMRGDPALLTGHIVFIRAILVIGHHGLHLAVRVFLVLIEQA